jgi:hypothetical protein
MQRVRAFPDVEHNQADYTCKELGRSSSRVQDTSECCVVPLSSYFLGLTQSISSRKEALRPHCQERVMLFGHSNFGSEVVLIGVSVSFARET